MIWDLHCHPAGFGGERPVARIARRRESENLAHFVVPVSTLGHGYRLYGDRCIRATVPPYNFATTSTIAGEVSEW